MNLLAFDTSTDQLSVALARGTGARQQRWQHHGAGGAQASAGLIAAVLALLQQAGLRLQELDAICFGSGPGSFTGLRTSCAVAQGLAFGAGVPVLPVNSLLALAQSARAQDLADWPEVQVQALLDARMDEIYCATFRHAAGVWTALQEPALCRAQDVRLEPQQRVPQVLAGNVFEVYRDRLALDASVHCIVAVPTADAMLDLAPQLLGQGLALPAAQATPVYVRDKVAQTSAERAAIKAAAAAAP